MNKFDKLFREFQKFKMWQVLCHSPTLQIIKMKNLCTGSNIKHLFCFGGGRESKSRTKNLEFCLFPWK